jgi:hypothetical protein
MVRSVTWVMICRVDKEKGEISYQETQFLLSSLILTCS